MLDMDISVVEFNANDRCDRCGAQAYTETSLEVEGGQIISLLWCLHHSKENSDRLELEGWKVAHDDFAISRLANNEHINV